MSESSAKEALSAALEVCKNLHKRIADLERTNLLMAEQFRKRDGFWLAPMAAPDHWSMDRKGEYYAMRQELRERK